MEENSVSAQGIQQMHRRASTSHQDTAEASRCFNINFEPQPRTTTPNYGEHIASTMKTSFPNITIVMDDCMIEEIW